MSRILSKRQENGLIEPILHGYTDGRVFWSNQGNSYVVLEATKPDWFSGPWTMDGKRVLLYSINGMGEVRWDVRPSSLSGVHNPTDPKYSNGDDEAIEYFRLTPLKWWAPDGY